MPGRFTRNDFEGKEWDYNSLSDKEKKAYDKKEFYYRKLAKKQQEAEEAWAKGDLTSETYHQINDELYKRQRMVLRNDYSFVDDNERDFNSKKSEGKKMSKKEYSWSNLKFDNNGDCISDSYEVENYERYHQMKDDFIPKEIWNEINSQDNKPIKSKSDFNSNNGKEKIKMEEKKKKYNGSVQYTPKKHKFSKPEYKLVREVEESNGWKNQFFKKNYKTKNYEVDSVKEVLSKNGKISKVHINNDYVPKKK